ncbi:hypothetical protein [Cryobacterium cryoconiti]|uniref:Uncharacterized protein n=1 Tax=Cryobacterium cryoconiti TaxID=1259239 RepID=A0A4Y8JU21_9MICO|nr:hypothetical protein [Cryobacterium cryoconiti]TFD27497.1 hypothetical protein E3T49_13220 [Cryobacterium cryoconiti]
MTAGRPEWATVAESATLTAAAERIRLITSKFDQDVEFPEYLQAALIDLPRAGFRSRKVAEATADLLEAVAASLPAPAVVTQAVQLATHILMPFADEGTTR